MSNKNIVNMNKKMHKNNCKFLQKILAKNQIMIYNVIKR